jgi:hypothetical protein
VIVYWLSRGNPAVTLRANLMVFFMICGVVLVVSYAAQGLFSGQTVALSLLLGIPYLFGVGIGARFFRAASDRLYRRIAYLIIALAALVSVPLFDPLFR